jgi:hypothetical protein
MTSVLSSGQCLPRELWSIMTHRDGIAIQDAQFVIFIDYATCAVTYIQTRKTKVCDVAGPRVNYKIYQRDIFVSQYSREHDRIIEYHIRFACVHKTFHRDYAVILCTKNDRCAPEQRNYLLYKIPRTRNALLSLKRCDCASRGLFSVDLPPVTHASYAACLRDKRRISTCIACKYHTIIYTTLMVMRECTCADVAMCITTVLLDVLRRRIR